MIELRIRCPCCDSIFTIVVDDIKISQGGIVLNKSKKEPEKKWNEDIKIHMGFDAGMK